jgi:hypothetical protein
VDQPDIQLDANRLVTFDGRVLEVFGGAVRRFHVALLTVTVSDPDKMGNRNLTLTQAGNDWALPADQSTFERLAPLLEALKDAGVTVRP